MCRLSARNEKRKVRTMIRIDMHLFISNQLYASVHVLGKRSRQSSDSDDKCCCCNNSNSGSKCCPRNKGNGNNGGNNGGSDNGNNGGNNSHFIFSTVRLANASRIISFENCSRTNNHNSWNQWQ